MSNMTGKKESELGKRRGIRILQHNMQRSKIVPHEIRTQMSADGNEILLMQEPYSIEGKVPRLGTEIAIACRGSKHNPPMAAVGVKSRYMTPLEIAGLCTTHCVSVQISEGATEIYAVSQYFLPTENIGVGIQQLEKVLRNLNGKRIIVGIDANAKSPLWYSRSTDDRGEALEAVIAQYGLHVINRPGQAYTFETTRGRSNIDITLASTELTPLVKEWKVHEDGTSSDHRILETRLDFDKQSTPPHHQERRYNTRVAN
jgi:hypothetical protein